MNPDHERVRVELRHEADAYVPDRASIAELTEARRRTAARRSRFRPAAAAAAVVAVVAAVSVAAWPRGDEPARRPAPVPVAAASAPAKPTRSPSPAPPSPAPPSSAPPSPGRTGWLESSGSVDKNSVATWTQNTVTVHNRRSAAHLIVTITVARTFDARRAGLYSTAPNNDVSTSVEVTATSLVYRFEVKSGASLAPGTWVFAAQFDHRSGRHRDADSYVVDARSGSGVVRESGDFRRT